jgi:toxin ParE1/3/4
MAEGRRVTWSSGALADLADTWDRYVKIAGRLTADKTLRDVDAACRTLEQRPFAGRARNEVRSGLRSLVAGPLVVFYRVTREDSVEVLRVLDRRRDVEDGSGTDGERR